MPPVLYFYGAGNVSALERASYDKDVRVVFTKKAYLCREANDQWRKIWCEFKAEHQFGVPVLLTMDNHSSQTRKQWRKEMRAHDTEILHTEPGGSHVCQLIDRHIGHMHKQLFEEVQMEYLLDSWDGFRHLSARDRRIHVTFWVGEVWRRYLACKRQQHANCVACSGLGIRLDGGDDNKITVEASPLFSVQPYKLWPGLEESIESAWRDDGTDVDSPDPVMMTARRPPLGRMPDQGLRPGPAAAAAAVLPVRSQKLVPVQSLSLSSLGPHQEPLAGA